MNRSQLTHCFTAFRSLGGVESILRRHQANDFQSGFHSRIVALFEPAEISADSVRRVGLTWRDSVRSSRAKFPGRAGTPWAGTAIYHNAWGLPFLADLDGAERRLAMLHSDLPILRQVLVSQNGLVDGVLCVSEPLRRQALARCPNLSPERLVVVPYPITVPRQHPAQSPLGKRPIVVGFAGRIVKEQKRVDRFPAFCRRLREAGLDFRFEVLGSGAQEAWLKTQLAGDPRVCFHGRLEGQAYWRVLSSWDAIIYVSDYEGLPISLLEAMSVGVLPIHPRIGTGGDAYAAQVSAELAYLPEDFNAVARLLHQLGQMSAEQVEPLRQKCRQLAAAHAGDGYEKTFAEFVQHIAALPRISATGPTKRGFIWSDFLPFTLLRRIHLGGFFRRASAAAAS